MARYKTNLDAVKDVAITLLYTDIAETKMSPLIVKHPFTDTGVAGFLNNSISPPAPAILDLSKNEDLERWRQKVKETIKNCTSAAQILRLITKSYKLTAINYVEPYLSRHDLSVLFNENWSLIENISMDANVTPSKLRGLLKKCIPEDLMDRADFAVFSALPETVTVYRGVTKYNKKYVSAFSWSTDKSVATWFAHRFGQGEGTVYQAEIAKEHIFAYFSCRDESEVVVDPKELQNVRPCC